MQQISGACLLHVSTPQTINPAPVPPLLLELLLLLLPGSPLLLLLLLPGLPLLELLPGAPLLLDTPPLVLELLDTPLLVLLELLPSPPLPEGSISWIVGRS